MSDIGKKVGYISFSYFSSIFKSVYGSTPSQYRESGAADYDDEKKS
ncbi:helix-turn-helix domain-containing protein [Cohnella abietis]